ncbi:MAG TPA: glycosyltransferase family 2 protein [Rhodanobacteraceae bacterium]|nr:glycosyltransferase family 2 protein [Rhodanobacteraceae bacterium]
MPLTEPLVSIIIVSADSGAGLRGCVTRALASSVPIEIILVDNASSDGVPQAIAREYADDARVRVEFNGANLGFGPAVNRGAKLVNAGALLILNPDCMLEPGTVAKLLDVQRDHPQAGVIGAVVCDANGEPDPASRRRDPLLRRSLMTLSGLARREDAGPKYAGVNVPGPMPDATVEVENVSGALMLVPRPVFEQLGGFDEHYFLHCEDLDLCRRARDAGFEVLLAGHVRVLHGKGGSSRHRPVFVSRHKHRGMWRWFRKFDPAARNPVTRMAVWCGIWLHFALTAPVLAIRRRGQARHQ